MTTINPTAKEIVQSFQPVKPKNLTYGFVQGYREIGQRIAFVIWKFKPFYHDENPVEWPIEYVVNFYHEKKGRYWLIELRSRDFLWLKKEAQNYRNYQFDKGG